jgi:hypothetical protein
VAERWPTVIASIADHGRERERELTSVARLPGEERGASGRGVAADGWGRPVSGRKGAA